MRNIVCWSVVVVSSALLTGCAADRVDLVAAGRLRVESTGLGALWQPCVWAQNGELTVHASSTQRTTRSHYPECVEVFVVAPDGTTLAHRETTVNHSRAGSGSSRLFLSSYSAHFEVIPPDGSVVKVQLCSQHRADPAPK